jgi:hypothetical protein
MISSTGESEKAADAWQREAFGRSPGLAEFLGQCEAFGTPVGMSSRSSGICEQPVNGLRKRSPSGDHAVSQSTFKFFNPEQFRWNSVFY